MEEGNKSSTKKIAEVEGSMGALEIQQAKLNNKVTLLEWDFSLNLKYWSQVVDFEAQMFGLHQDWISGMEETLRALSTKVSVCSTWVDRLKLTEHFSRLTFLVLRQGGDTETSL